MDVTGGGGGYTGCERGARRRKRTRPHPAAENDDHRDSLGVALPRLDHAVEKRDLPDSSGDGGELCLRRRKVCRIRRGSALSLLLGGSGGGDHCSVRCPLAWRSRCGTFIFSCLGEASAGAPCGVALLFVTAYAGSGVLVWGHAGQEAVLSRARRLLPEAERAV